MRPVPVFSPGIDLLVRRFGCAQRGFPQVASRLAYFEQRVALQGGTRVYIRLLALFQKLP
jgi:hypothetical protein